MEIRDYRLYINSFDTEFVWSIDTGPGTSERHFKQVGFDSFGVSKVDLTANNVDSPKAWIEFQSSVLHINKDTAHITKYLDIE